MSCRGRQEPTQAVDDRKDRRECEKEDVQCRVHGALKAAIAAGHRRMSRCKGECLGEILYKTSPRRRLAEEAGWARSPSGRLTKMSTPRTATQKRNAAACAFQSFDCHIENHSPPITMNMKKKMTKPSSEAAITRALA